MAFLDIYEIREEITVQLRNADIFTIAQRGVTTTTDLFNGDGATTAFVLTTSPVRNVRKVEISAVDKSLGTDYNVDYSTKTVTFVTAPPSGVNNIDIQYDNGNTDKIFPDFPRNDLSLNSFPRIGVDVIASTSVVAGFGNAHRTEILFSVVIYGLTTKSISDFIRDIRTSLITDRNDFFHFSVLVPTSMGPLIKSPNKSDKILSQNVDFTSILNYEIN